MTPYPTVYGVPQPGQVLFTPNPSTVRWVFQPAGTPASSLPSGVYRVALRGNGSSIITAQGAPLDGEPGQQFPSGDNVAGGDFVFNLTVS